VPEIAAVGWAEISAVAKNVDETNAALIGPTSLGRVTATFVTLPARRGSVTVREKWALHSEPRASATG
jgi:hypothetical protein